MDLNDAPERVRAASIGADERARGARLQTVATWLPMVVVPTILPFVLHSFVVFQVTMVLIYAIAIIGLNLLIGFNGQPSLGHAAFYAIGAYTAAILIGKFGINYAWTLPAAAAVCFAFGFLFGFPALRLDGIHLALATFALSVATPQILKLSLFEEWTGGVQGIVITKPDAPAGLPLTSDQWLYFLTLAATVAMYSVARNLIRTRTGRALMAIRDNPLAARSMGINVPLYKAVTFGVSGLYAGVAGALGAIVVQFVAPDSFTIHLSVALLVGLVVGGVGWLPGAFLGAAFILFVPNVAEHFSKGLSGAIYGLILIVLMLMMPSGTAGLARLVASMLKN
jgi:branched-chain amino acid transport system permease protein